MDLTDWLSNFLVNNPLLLLFLVLAIGYPIGQVKWQGANLGVAAILFVGLAFGSLHPDLKLPEIIYQLGLLLFVYTVGIANGESFITSFKRHGLRDNIFTLSLLVFLFFVTISIAHLFGLKGTYTSGLFVGSLTNTPALAASIEFLKPFTNPGVHHLITSEPVIAYSITYPMGVISMILTIVIFKKIMKIKDFGYPTSDKQNTDIQNVSVLVLNEQAMGISLLSLSKANQLKIIFTRIKSDEGVSIANKDSVLRKYDIVSIVGTPNELDKAVALLGEKSPIKLDEDRSEIEYRRVLVSNTNIVGYKLGELNLEQTLGVIPTRIRRGDVDFLPDQFTVLQPGDRIRIVSEKSKIEKASAYLGDSFKSLSEIDIFTFSIGIALGLLLGTLPLVFAQNFSIRMGLAGGPLVVALILGYMGRTGPLVWTMPYNTNLTLRQIGITLFLAGVGTRSGYAFKDTIMHQPIGISLFIMGIVLTTVAAFTYLFIGYKYLKIPFAKLLGMLAGFQTQPAVLGFANELTKHEKTNEGYAAVFPIATIAKIVLAQLILILL